MKKLVLMFLLPILLSLVSCYDRVSTSELKENTKQDLAHRLAADKSFVAYSLAQQSLANEWIAYVKSLDKESCRELSSKIIESRGKFFEIGVFTESRYQEYTSSQVALAKEVMVKFPELAKLVDGPDYDPTLMVAYNLVLSNLRTNGNPCWDACHAGYNECSWITVIGGGTNTNACWGGFQASTASCGGSW